MSVVEVHKADYSEEDKRKAEEDAHHLAHAHAIRKDAKRHEKAIEAAKRLNLETQENAQEAQNHAQGMNDLASQMYPTMAASGQMPGQQGA
ncbi:MAG: hypothetical protein ACP5IL_12900 [Syntrophobacteraceae bacterium]